MSSMYQHIAYSNRTMETKHTGGTSHRTPLLKTTHRHSNDELTRRLHIKIDNSSKASLPCQYKLIIL